MSDRNTDRYRLTPEQRARADSDIRWSAVFTAPNGERRREAVALTDGDRDRTARSEVRFAAVTAAAEGSTGAAR